MKTALVVLALVLPAAAFGMMFKWTDSKGVTHFTNKEYEVPDHYRTKARRLYPEQVDSTSQQNPPVQQATKPDPQTPALRIPPDAQSRPQLPAAASEQRNPADRPSHGRRVKNPALTPPEE